VVGTLGLIDRPGRPDGIVGPSFQSEGDLILLLGPQGDALGGSEYLRVIHHQERGVLPDVDIAQELAVQQVCRALIAAGLARSAHDCAEGGLAVALAESAFGTMTPSTPRGLGAVVSIAGAAHLRADGILFGEWQSRIILTIQENKLEAASKIISSFSAPWAVIGRVGGDRLTITVAASTSSAAAAPAGRPVIDIDLTALHTTWRLGLPQQMGDAS
jgi:phosphoribosylformylglycinamidine synthase